MLIKDNAMRTRNYTIYASNNNDMIVLNPGDTITQSFHISNKQMEGIQFYSVENRELNDFTIDYTIYDNNNVLDRSIYEDSLLFHLNADLGRADETEVEVYDDLLNNMLEEIDSLSFKKRPDLLIHVKVSFDKMLERIKKRGRQFEQLEYDPSLYDYYKELNSRYDTWFEAFDICPKIQIDGDKYDFVEDEQSKIHVLQQIKEKLKEIEGENN